MIVTDLDGNEYEWHFRGLSKNERVKKKSSFHLKARSLLKEVFPTLQIIEEVPIIINSRNTLYLDFYIPLKKLAVEVQGEQHYGFSSFFHKNKLEFLKAQKRDKDKQEWCRVNDIDLICLPHFEKIDEWRKYFVA